MQELPAEARPLFALPLSEFTAARDSLATLLKNQGRHVEAVEVKGLRKPSITAWALNQMAHRSPKKVAWLLRSADRLREVSSRSELREASVARSELVGSFVAEALQVLASAGNKPGPQAAQRMAQTLLAAMSDPRLASVLSKGMLQADAMPGDPDLSWGTAIPVSRPVPTIRDALSDEVERLREAWRGAEERQAQLEARAEQAKVAVERATVEAVRARSAYEEAWQRLEEMDK